MVTLASGIGVVVFPASVKEAPVTRAGLRSFLNSQVELSVPVGPSTLTPMLPSRLEAQALATDWLVPRAISMWSGEPGATVTVVVLPVMASG
ncbi:MAG: hypothetical protein IPK12_24150, partial [Gemmatimonadetes bacterium]|nr:hypothetical protein [Gemmatimonadota bacterium]